MANTNSAHESGVSVKVDVAGHSHKGRVKASNEDHFLIAEVENCFRTTAGNVPTDSLPPAQPTREYGWIVADGVGSGKGGELASRMLIEAVAPMFQRMQHWRSSTSSLEAFHQRCLDDFHQIDAAIQDRARLRPELTGMGTTMTLGWCNGRQLFLAHAGDSRAYLFRNGTLHQLTDDHTVAASQVVMGEITSESEARSSDHHVLSNAFGGDRGVAVDMQQMKLEDGDVLLLCTDGVSNMLKSNEISQILQAAPDARASCQLLLQNSLNRGGLDNLTAIVARFEVESRDTDSEHGGR